MPRYYNNSSYWDYLSYLSLPLHLSFFIIVIVFIIGFTWYINTETKFEDFVHHVKLFIMITPIVLLLLVHCLSSSSSSWFFVPFPERESVHRAGASPWGVAALLVFLIYMISHQSSWHERWFPLITK
ncbi:hypothetical protein ACOSQ4_017650 [Xanthoceras sorbifolium]